MRRHLFPLVAVFALAGGTAAWAGPPFATDDPQPTDTGHWEVYAFANAAHTPGVTAGESGLDLNYGAAKDLQLTLVVPAAYEASASGHLGMGVVEAAVKLKLLHQKAGTWTPDVAVFPRLFIPTASRGFGSGKLGVLLPVWAGKDFGPWSVFVGGGYQINPGAGNRNYWTGGVALTRTLGDRLSLGGEVYHRTADALGGRDLSGFNVGGSYRLTRHWSLLAAGGPGIQHARDEGQYSLYVALKADY